MVAILFKQGHSCSYCLKQCKDAEIFHSYFISEVYQFHLPTVLSGGQPRPCAWSWISIKCIWILPQCSCRKYLTVLLLQVLCGIQPLNHCSTTHLLMSYGISEFYCWNPCFIIWSPSLPQASYLTLCWCLEQQNLDKTSSARSVTTQPKGKKASKICKCSLIKRNDKNQRIWKFD